MIKVVKHIAAASLIAAVSLSAASHAAADNLRADHRIYHGQSVPLLRDPSRLAVQATDPAALANALSGVGLDHTKISAATIPGCHHPDGGDPPLAALA